MTWRMPPLGGDLIIVVCSYVLGCFTVGYYWTQWRIGQDIRLLGSGNIGASNVGRSLGALGFVVTFVGDFAKGALAVWAAHSPSSSSGSTVAGACMVAVVAGHIWPAQLGFRGGKGIAASLGAILLYDYRISLMMLAAFAASSLVLRSYVLCGMLSYAVCSPAALIAGVARKEALVIALVSIVVVFAHRENMRKAFANASITWRPIRQSGSQIEAHQTDESSNKPGLPDS